ncbi:predicted protein [Lichtheimia corymbifera JMRC:FSU:9682]|uniref:C2H2-type domain-containing protein n=1 Tax=Lichtheimia corymbifera JMRC:FSU:9682 TaxID=1263082 RepID=A0A068SF11_9FUNG|nr:predicted protein [Lichtheimia corymbifera JMRC:FSU:9682]
MSSSFTPHHPLSDTAEVYIPGYINSSAIVQGHDPNLHAQDVLGTDQLTVPLWMLPTPEDYPTAYDVPYATHNCYIPDGLSSAGLISQMLHPYYAQWVGSGNIPLETVTEMTAPTSLLSSSSLPSWPHDRVHSLPTATSENIGRRIAVLVSQVVTQSTHGLEDIDFVLQVIRWVVTIVADDNFSREYYFRLTVNHLYPFRTSWNGLYHTPFPAAVEIATPLPSLSTQSTSPPPQEAVHVPATPNDVSSNETTQGFACDYCDRTFSRVDSLNRHLDETCTYTTKKQHCTNTKKERFFMNTFSARK